MQSYALIQNKGDGHLTVVKNGEILNGSEKERAIELIHSVQSGLKQKYIQTEFYCKIKGKTYCCVFHGERDDYGRLRPCIFVWEKGCDIQGLAKTASAIGVDIQKISELKAANDKCERKTLAIGAALGAIIGGVIAEKSLAVGIIGGAAVGICAALVKNALKGKI